MCLTNRQPSSSGWALSLLSAVSAVCCLLSAGCWLAQTQTLAHDAPAVPWLCASQIKRQSTGHDAI